MIFDVGSMMKSQIMDFDYIPSHTFIYHLRKESQFQFAMYGPDFRRNNENL